MPKIRVLIIDDHPMMRRGLREMLSGEENIEICGEAADVDEALEMQREMKPQVALLDISLPSGSGLDLAKQMLAIDKDLRILCVSMHDDAVFAERALRVGAIGYVNKSLPGSEMIAAVRRVAQGDMVLCQSVADRLMRRAVSKSRDPAVGIDRLSDRELEIFELIGRGLSTRDVADRLCLSVKTVETHRENIKRKLGFESGTELSHQATIWANEQA